MDDRQTDRLIEAISNLTAATTEVAVKLKRVAQTNPITPEVYRYIVDSINSKTN